jgi:hypothetical protein
MIRLLQTEAPMKTSSKASLLSRAGLLYAILGISAATQAQAFFRMDERPPPNGANGLSLNGLSLNGLSANGLSLNGLSANGLSANGLISKNLRLKAVLLSNGEQVDLH